MKRINRALRRLARKLSVEHVVLIAELLVYGVVFVGLITGNLLASIDRWGSRADVIAALLALGMFTGVHALVKRYLLPAIKRYYLPAGYDDRSILFDLGQEARAAKDLDQLYRFIAWKIGDALQTETVAIFTLDEPAGHYTCRIASEFSENRGPWAEAPVGAVSAPQLSLSRDAFVVKRIRHLQFPMDIGPDDFEVWRKAFAIASPAARENREREIATLEAVRARLLLQIMIKEQLVGILALGPRLNQHSYSVHDKQMLMSVAGQLAFVIENSRLVERMVAEEQLRRELALAAEVQQRLFPEYPPASLALEMASFCQPARGVGGDYYDFLAFGNGQIGIAIADVAGKGISAALLMSSVQASLRSQAVAHNDRPQSNCTVADIVSRMNQLLCRSTGSASYATFFYAQFEELTGRLTYVNAGHNPPFLIQRSGTSRRAMAGSNCRLRTAAEDEAGDAVSGVLFEPAEELASIPEVDAPGCVRLEAGGSVIGLFDPCPYEEESLDMQPGDLLFAYTDGVTEAINAAGEEFGEQRLREILLSSASLSAEEVRDRVVSNVQAWCEGVAQHDDLTFVVVKVK